MDTFKASFVDEVVKVGMSLGIDTVDEGARAQGLRKMQYAMDRNRMARAARAQGAAKTAARVSDNLIGRMAAVGGLAGGGSYAAQKALAGIGSGDDPAASGDSMVGRVGRTAVGGALAALILKALAKMGKR
jgi:hypothetical protein